MRSHKLKASPTPGVVVDTPAVNRSLFISLTMAKAAQNMAMDLVRVGLQGLRPKPKAEAAGPAVPAEHRERERRDRRDRSRRRRRDRRSRSRSRTRSHSHRSRGRSMDRRPRDRRRRHAGSESGRADCDTGGQGDRGMQQPIYHGKFFQGSFPVDCVSYADMPLPLAMEVLHILDPARHSD